MTLGPDVGNVELDALRPGGWIALWAGVGIVALGVGAGVGVTPPMYNSMHSEHRHVRQETPAAARR